MSISTRLISLCLFIAAHSVAFSIPINSGASYAQVIAALGKPDGEIEAGSRKILTYGKAQIKLQNGKIISISPELDKLLVERDADKKSVEAKRAAGLIDYKGKWMYPRERDALVASENKQKSALAVRSQPQSGWITDYDQALATAKAQNKKVFLNFTGSDWCGWCIKLDKEVFSQKEFLDYAKENYILVKIDFPSRSKLPDDLNRQNETLAKKYKIKGFPSIVVLKSNGKKYKTGGYVPGGPSAFIKTLR